MLETVETEGLRHQINEHYLARKRRNGSYSLRCFARDLQMDASHLSKIMRGDINLSLKVLHKISNHLELSISTPKQSVAVDGSKTFKVLEADVFSAISDWYHFAILELCRTDDFQSDKKWIASHLGITPFEVQIAIERLQRLRLIEVDTDGLIWERGSDNATGLPPGSAPAWRTLQRQLLEKAIDHLQITPVEMRDNSSITVAINTEDIPRLKEVIGNFRREFAAIAEKSNQSNEVYNLSVSLFPCSQRRH